MGLSGRAASSTARRPLPPASASPVTVASAYLAAAKDVECSFTQALTQPKSTWNWCDDPRLLDYRSVGAARFVPASAAGVNEQCVPVEMDTLGSSDGSMPTGWQRWSLYMIDTNAGRRVHDQGQG